MRFKVNAKACRAERKATHLCSVLPHTNTSTESIRNRPNWHYANKQFMPIWMWLRSCPFSIIHGISGYVLQVRIVECFGRDIATPNSTATNAVGRVLANHLTVFDYADKQFPFPTQKHLFIAFCKKLQFLFTFASFETSDF